MANYSNLKAAIADVIKTNGTKAITGQVLQDTLNSIVSVIGANYQFAGVATPATNPGTPDQNVFYVAMQGGTYTNFNATALPEGISLLMWNGSWSSQVISYNDGGVFDISVYKSTGGTLATFADLAAALGTNGANVPVAARKGGMSVRFVQSSVQSSDNKYVQYFLTKNTWSAKEDDWEKVNLSNEIGKIDEELNGIKYKVKGTTSSVTNTLRIPCDFLTKGRKIYACLTSSSSQTISVGVFAYDANNQYFNLGTINALNTELEATIQNDGMVSIGFYNWSGAAILMSGYVRAIDTSSSIITRVSNNENSISDIENEIEEIQGDINNISSIKTAEIENLLTNGDFHTQSSGWITENCNMTVANNVGTLTGDGTQNTMKLHYYFPIDIENNPYMFSICCKVENGCNLISVDAAGGWATTRCIPVAGKWYQIIVRYSGTKTGTITLIGDITFHFTDTTAQNSATVQVKGAVCFLTGEDFGLGVNPMMWKLVKMMSYNEPWIGKQEVIIWKDEPKTIESPKDSYATRRRPIVTFIDDDGYQAVYNKFVGFSQKYNIPFVSAVSINSTINDWDALELINTYGWEIAPHPSCGHGGLATLETEAEIEDYMVRTNNYLTEHGFPFENIVYADGEPDERVRRIAKKYYKCGAVGSYPMLNYGVIANFEIHRYPIAYGAPGNWNLDTYKGFVDAAIEKNAWLLFMTHCNMESHTEDTQQMMDGLIQYIQSCGVEIMTLKDGFKIFGNALECGDFTGKDMQNSNGFAIDKNGNIASKNVLSKESLQNLLSTLSSAIGVTISATYNEVTQEYDFAFVANN